MAEIPTNKSQAKSLAKSLAMAALSQDSITSERASVVLSAVFAFSLGLGLLTMAGFAQSAHDVAHDSRHAFSFPCH